MNLSKRIFNARISGKSIVFKRRMFLTRFVNRLLKHKVLRVDISQPGNLGEGELVFRLNDPVFSNGAEYAVDQRILFSRLNINGIVRVA